MSHRASLATARGIHLWKCWTVVCMECIILYSSGNKITTNRSQIDMSYVVNIMHVGSEEGRMREVWPTGTASLEATESRWPYPDSKDQWSTSIRYRSDTSASDRCLIDVDPTIFAIWVVVRRAQKIVPASRWASHSFPSTGGKLGSHR